MLRTGRAKGQSVARGISLFLLSTILFAGMDALIKWLSAGYPTHELLFFRAAFGLLPILLWLGATGGLGRLRTARLGRHAIRGLINTALAYCFFFAFARLPLADVYAVGFAAPLFITTLSVPFLGERVGPRRWTAVLAGFAGVLIVLRPGASGFAGMDSVGAAAALVGALFYAFNAITARQIGRTDSSAAIVVYSGVVTLAASTVLIAVEGFVTPDPGDFALLATIGLVGGVAALCFAEAVRHAPVAVLAPFEYTAMLWAVGLGYAVWGDLPDAWVWTGSAIVIASGIYIIHRETYAAQRPSEVPAR